MGSAQVLRLIKEDTIITKAPSGQETIKPSTRVMLKSKSTKQRNDNKVTLFYKSMFYYKKS
jgi:hypothetical protein